MLDAPTPIIESPILMEKLEENKLSLAQNNKNYTFSWIKTSNDSILFNLNLDSDLNIYYYELDYKSNLLTNLSKLFIFCENLDESYNLLTENLEKNQEDINFEIFKDTVNLSFKLNLPTGKKETIHITLKKKIFNIDSLLDKFNSKINYLQENQKNIEKNINDNFIGINELINKQNNMENIIKEIDQIKNFYDGLDNQENKINKIEKSQRELNFDLDKIKKLNNENKKNEVEKEKIKEIIKIMPNIELKLNSFENENDNIQVILNENKDKYKEINQKLINNQNIIGKNNEKIKIIKDNQEKMNNDINEKNIEINTIKSKQEKLKIKNKENNNLKNILKEIENLQKENLELKKIIDENDKKLELYIESVKKKFDTININKKEIKDIKEEINDPKKEKKDINNPKNFVFQKTISRDLFTRNFYNNRACLFCSLDDNIYIAYGVSSFNLECYDIINDKKFILIEKLHKNFFDSCRYFYDENNKRDLLITTSLDAHVKIIHFKKEKSEVILDLNFESDQKVIINTAILSYETIIIPFSKEGIVKFYTLNSEFIGQLEENAGFILGLSNYYCKKKKRSFLLVANLKGIFAYIIDCLKLYKKFIPKIKESEKENICFDEAYIIEKDNSIILIGPRFDSGYIYFWDFVKGDLIDTININSGISDICLWDNEYIFASLNRSESQFALININKVEIEKNFFVDKKDSKGSGIKVLRHESKGNFLICYSLSGKLDLYKM